MSAGNAANADDAVRFHGLVIADPGVNSKLFLHTPTWQHRQMSRDLINQICATLPGAEVSDPWGGGHDAWKVGGKMFACIGAVMPGVSVKCDSVETAELLIDAGAARRAPYFHRSWVNVPFDAPREELIHRLRQSYSLVRAGLTKKAQATLAPWP